MWRQRVQARAIREREARKLLARPPEPVVPAEKKGNDEQRQPAKL